MGYDIIVENDLRMNNKLTIKEKDLAFLPTRKKKKSGKPTLIANICK